jgi:hypothetical protein
MIPLNEGERAYMLELIRLIREATQRCSAASAQWNKLNDEFNMWYDRQYPDLVKKRPFPATGSVRLDPLHYLNTKAPNVPMKAANEDWSHWEREVQRLAAALQAENTIREMLDA